MTNITAPIGAAAGGVAGELAAWVGGGIGQVQEKVPWVIPRLAKVAPPKVIEAGPKGVPGTHPGGRKIVPVSETRNNGPPDEAVARATPPVPNPPGLVVPE